MRPLVLAVLLGAAAAADPVAKVIKLLEDLKKGVETAGTDEAKAYGKYACFCKDTTKTKATSIKDGEDSINDLSADITDNTASKEEKEAEVKKRKAKVEELGTELSTTVARCSTQHAEFEAGDADMAKAIASLKSAIKIMNSKKAAAAKKAALAAVKAHTAKSAKSFLELDESLVVDPSDPAYKYHSKTINDMLSKALKSFEDDKSDDKDKWDKTKSACQDTKDGFSKQMIDNKDAITKAETKIEKLAKQIAKDRGDLVKAQGVLEDDAAYLKDLTAQCEVRATEYDQRSSTRNDEITALATAIKIISNKVTAADKEVNRALVQLSAKPLSFLQASPIKATNFLATRATLSTAEQALQAKAVTVLRTEGSRLASAELEMMAMKISGPDHFKEVKIMIQKLIERLLDEKKAEASKKGFCDQELAKAQSDRDSTKNKADGMSADLKAYEATKEELEAEIKKLKKDIKQEESDYQEAKDERRGDKEANEKTLDTANKGLDALNEAILVLKAFYNNRGPKVLLQASPVDDDTSGPGFSGGYKGSEKKSRAIFAVLETISSDFQKTISETEKAEATAAADFVELDRKSKSTLASKETKKELDNTDLKQTKDDITKTLDDLETMMGLNHDALKMIESLKPACLDAGGMNSEQRGEKRDQEIKALNQAICMLEDKKDVKC